MDEGITPAALGQHDIPAWMPGEVRTVTVYGVPVSVVKVQEEGATLFQLSAQRFDSDSLESETWSEGNVPPAAAELAAFCILSQIADGTACLKPVEKVPR